MVKRTLIGRHVVWQQLVTRLPQTTQEIRKGRGTCSNLTSAFQKSKFIFIFIYFIKRNSKTNIYSKTGCSVVYKKPSFYAKQLISIQWRENWKSNEFVKKIKVRQLCQILNGEHWPFFNLNPIDWISNIGYTGNINIVYFNSMLHF